jgi:protein gp37
MAATSSIEWTDATWQVVTGCSVVSPGCTNCYAMRMAGTRLKNLPSRVGLTQPTKAGPVWTGEVRFNREWLLQPLSWRTPKKVFVCAHGDLFADGVEDEWLDLIFAVMALTPQHTYQVLTKRPERAKAYIDANRTNGCGLNRALGGPLLKQWEKARRARVNMPAFAMPLPNVWLGVSAEDQRRADERIPVLLDTPAAFRFVSLEPLLGPIHLTRIQAPRYCPADHELDWKFSALDTGDDYELRDDLGYSHGSDGPDRPHRLDWVIVGGESGPGARPMHPDWARRIRDDCDAASVPFFFKQWGVWEVNSTGHSITGGRVPGSHSMTRTATFADGLQMNLVGKHAAGRLLDGVEHNMMPGAGLV